jgi:Glycosyl hydrolase family 46
MTIPAPFDPKCIDFIRRIVSVAETDAPVWDPASVYVYNDGNQGRKQCTLSIGFTADGGNLRKVLERYGEAHGVYGAEFAPYITLLKEGDPGTDADFIALLKEAGKKDPLMMTVQEEMFDKLYLGPAFSWASKYGFGLPLSYLVIADSFLHSGSMLDFLMNRFPEEKPNDGGNEEKWIKAYTDTRRDWLANHSNKILRNTVYRCDCYLREVKRSNWDLAQTPIDMHGTEVV